MMAKAAKVKQPLVMSVVNWGEVCYSLVRGLRREVAQASAIEQVARTSVFEVRGFSGRHIFHALF
jgi:hypothetical protein